MRKLYGFYNISYQKYNFLQKGGLLEGEAALFDKSRFFKGEAALFDKNRLLSLFFCRSRQKNSPSPPQKPKKVGKGASKAKRLKTVLEF
ncbi:MAG: hypothetical protein J6L87_01755 [Clostridia bacterium]|nr:hypothetical protein [Clostridia bacterium]